MYKKALQGVNFLHSLTSIGLRVNSSGEIGLHELPHLTSPPSATVELQLVASSKLGLESRLCSETPQSPVVHDTCVCRPDIVSITLSGNEIDTQTVNLISILIS